MASNRKMPSTPKLADYDIVISEAFLRLVREQGVNESYEFEKKLLEDVIKDLVSKRKIRKSGIKNIADIKYTYDARRDFPSTISSKGHWAITGRGKGKYTFQKIKQSNLIRIPEDFGGIQIQGNSLMDKTPAPVSEVLGNDEQATMARLMYNNLLSRFLGMETYHVQGHERTFLSCGQIEVDEVYVGKDDKRKYIIPISGKGGDTDSLSYTQALNLSLYGMEKKSYTGFVTIPLGVTRQTTGEIYVVEFTCASDIHGIKIKKVGKFTLINERDQ